MASQLLRLSLSQPYDLQWYDVEVTSGGALIDPRSAFTPQFQLLNTDEDGGDDPLAFGPWAAGDWDGVVPTANGPYSATFTVGPGADDALNPGIAGTFRVWARLFQSLGQTPTWPIGLVLLSAP